MHLFRLLFLIASFLIAHSQASAACTNIAELSTDKLYVDISDGGCGELLISFSQDIASNGKPREGTIKSFAFDKECTLSNNKRGIPAILSCHAKGHTPLAGASYRREFGGYETRVYDGSSKKEKVPYYRYICTKGCNGTAAPKVLYEIW
jgi:hypothetical protein